MHNTFYNRGNIEGTAFPPYPRMAAEEYQIEVMGPMEPKRPQPIRGTVHDENAWALDGVSGHAGIFSTVEDTGILCQMILNNGTYGGVRILSSEVVDLIFHNFNTKFPGDDHGLGFELDQYYTAGPMASLQVFALIPSLYILRALTDFNSLSSDCKSYWLHRDHTCHLQTIEHILPPFRKRRTPKPTLVSHQYRSRGPGILGR